MGEVFHPIALALLLVVTTALGAASFGALFDGPIALIGLFPAVYGLIGAFTYLLWLRLGQAGENRLRAFRLIGVLMAFQLGFSLLFGASPVWVAEVAGFVVGFLASVHPGARRLERVRGADARALSPTRCARLRAGGALCPRRLTATPPEFKWTKELGPLSASLVR